MLGIRVSTTCACWLPLPRPRHTWTEQSTVAEAETSFMIHVFSMANRADEHPNDHIL